MKNIFAFLFFFSAVLANMTTVSAQTAKGHFLNKKSTLSAGTMVILESTDLIKTGQATVGQLVNFRVRTNVEAEGEVVIATGALGLGRIKSIEKASYNNPEVFHIEVTNVQAVDGQMVSLTGQELQIKGKYAGQEAGAEPGKTITAYVTNDIKIKH